ncbi:hypothetical protein QNI19_30065 [Cytophagaceae bacterium DM2B3-1]|uniref:Aspartyl protease n=1 Tax=Xanthocytophaga flava TaxID=3048013 RepID=A0ABT7CU02_9BACT|nr:hypothetical protein [Xanthocytophaga flavus]MDJ1472556.1 hypothetical protein [Xanthocytophaga flavus]MDJ1497222.1 hypothetical protein [Xanthocytophaga flavus]
MQITILLRASILTIIYFINSFVSVCLAQQIPQTPTNTLILPAEDYQMDFQWYTDTLQSKPQSYTALLIPVHLPHCDKLFYMQFDSGSPYSLFYTNKLKAIQARYPKSVQIKDSADKLTNFSFRIGGQKILAKEITIRQFDKTSIHWKEKNSIEIIGTIGVDVFENKTLVIDYPAKKIFIGNGIPTTIASGLSLSDFIFVGKRILLPALLKNKKTILYFDTGSSAYPLLTDKETSLSLSVPNSTPVQYQVKSWEKILTANTLPTKDSIEIAGNKLPLHTVTYMDGVSNAQVMQMKKMGIGGMTGNALFLKYILVLDTKNKKFGASLSSTE